jgi:chromosome partitioning protein
MQIFSMIAQKGGTGKTTLLLNLAVAAEEQGHKTLIIDLDSQSSACKWADRRNDKVFPNVMDAQPERLAKAIEQAPSHGFDVVFIDTPAKSGDAGLAAARVASLVLIPCRPQMLDIETIRSTKDILKIANNPKAVAILNMAPPVGFRRREEATAAIATFGLEVCAQAISMRAVFGDATALGLTALEYESEGLGAQEIRELYKQLSRLVGKQKSRGLDDVETTRSQRVG